MIPPIALVGFFMIMDLITHQNNIWISAVGTLGWWIYSVILNRLNSKKTAILVGICVAFLVFIVGMLIYIRFFAN